MLAQDSDDELAAVSEAAHIPESSFHSCSLSELLLKLLPFSVQIKMFFNPASPPPPNFFLQILNTSDYFFQNTSRKIFISKWDVCSEYCLFFSLILSSPIVDLGTTFLFMKLIWAKSFVGGVGGGE